VRYWDSSALLPLLVREAASATMRACYEADPDVCAGWTTPIECVSAISRREREGAMTEAGAEGAIRRLRALWASVRIVPADERVAAAAMRALRVHALRAADAVQLAAALVIAESRPLEWEFVCLDGRLAAAARREGLNVIDGS
jgi:predicted nucleic acid-binding protein